MRKVKVKPDPEKTIVDRKYHLTVNDQREVIRVLGALMVATDGWKGERVDEAKKLAARLVTRPNLGIVDRMYAEIDMAINVLTPTNETLAEKSKKRELASFLRVARLNVAKDQ